jgi:single-strand DNA-binding protein
MSVNKALLIGNLGKDPEVRFTASGRAVARFPVATSEVWNDAEGQRQERTEWHNVVVWGKQAETCGQYLAKGRQVFVEGSIRTRQYDDKEGNRRYITEIVAMRVQFLSARGGAPMGDEAGDFGGGGARGRAPAAVGAGDDVAPMDDEDIPF